MSDKSSKNKILIISAVCMVAIIAVLVIAIVMLNKDKDNDNTEKPTGVLAENDANITKIPDNDSKSDVQNGDEITSSPEATPSQSPDTETKTSEDADNSISVVLGDYSGLKAEYKPVIITDSDIDSALEQLRKEATHTKNLPDRAFENGDMAILTFTAYLDGKEVDELSGSGLQDTIGSGIMPEEVDNEIIGKKIGDKFEKDFDYPESFDALPSVAGKTVHFVFELIDGFYYDVPEANDDFIKSNTSYSSVEEYRTKEKERLQEEADKKAEEELENDIKKQLIAVCEFSDKLYDMAKLEYVNKIQDELTMIANEYYIDPEYYYYYEYGMTLEEYQKSLMESVKLDVLSRYALDEIAKLEKLVPDSEDVEEIFTEEFIEKRGYTTEENVHTSFSDEEINTIVEPLALRRKALKLVMEKAEITGK